MNIQSLVTEIKRFGDHIVVVHNHTKEKPEYTQMLIDVCNELDKQQIQYVKRNQDEYQQHIDFHYDVVLLLNTSTRHHEDEYPKTVLVVGKKDHTDEGRHWATTEDRWLWNDSTFVNFGMKQKTILDLCDPADRKSSWYTAIDLSFKKLKPYADEKIMFPVFAGPIQEYAIDKLPTLDLVEHIKQGLYLGYERIMFDDKDEAIFWHRVYKVHSVARRLLKIVPPGSFFFMTSALNAEEIYARWCEQHNEEPLLQMIPCARFESVAKDMMLDNGLQWHHEELDYEISTQPRPYKFLCYNRMPRLHRLKMLTELHKKDLHRQALISFHNEDGFLSNVWWRKFQTLPHQDSHWLPTFKYFFEHIFPNLDDYKLNKTEKRWNPVDIKKDDFAHFENTYFSVINETLFYKVDYKYKDLLDISPTDSVFLSEKIFKPLACKHPFVVLGVDKTLSYLKQYGYKTFDKWINESYDNEPDDDKRMEMCVAEIERLTNLSDDEWCRMIEEMIPTLQHNFDTLCRNKNLIVKNLNMLEILRNDRPY